MLMLWVCFVFLGVKINYIYVERALFGCFYEEVSCAVILADSTWQLVA